MKIVVCYKLVPDETGMSFKHDGTPDFSACEWQIGRYDLSAVEAGAQLAEASGNGQLIALTVGGEIVENSKLKKSVLSRGPQEMLAIEDPTLTNADSYAVAEIIAESVQAIGDVDLVLFGEGSGDSYSQQTGNMTGALLGWNTLNAVGRLSEENGTLIAERELENCTETLRVSLPAAVTVTSNICLPRLTSMKEILKAGKKPAVIRKLDEITAGGENRVRTVEVSRQARSARNGEILQGDQTGIDELLLRLRKLI